MALSSSVASEALFINSILTLERVSTYRPKLLGRPEVVLNERFASRSCIGVIFLVVDPTSFKAQPDC